jgi:tetratricopeptide (TPR) repeat protein
LPALRFRIFGVPIEIRASFPLLIGLIGLPTHWSPELTAGWLIVVCGAVLVHELGHAAAFIAFGDRPQIVLHGAGGHTAGSHPGVRRMIVVSIAGPLAGLALGGAVLLVAPSLPADPFTHQLVGDALFATFGLSVLNLLPIAPFDGRIILDSAIAAAAGRPAGWLGTIGGVVVLVALTAGLILLGRIDLAIFLGIFAVIQAGLGRGSLRGLGTQASAGHLVRLGRLTEGLAAAESALQRNPRDVDAMLSRAAALSIMTRYAEAETEYNGLLALVPATPPALAGRFRVLRALGRLDAAQQDLDALLATPLTDVDSVGTRFFALYVDHQYERALQVVHAGLALPGVGGAHRDLLRSFEVILQEALGRPEAALQIVGELIARRPDQFELHEAAALALIQLGRFDEARRHADRALAGAPQHPELLETRGIVERLSGRPDRAVEFLLSAAIKRPDLPRARAELAVGFTQLGRHAEAAAALDSLPRWEAADPNLLYARAAVDAAAGRYDAAERQLANAAQIRPGLGRVARLDPIFLSLHSPARAGLDAPPLPAGS